MSSESDDKDDEYLKMMIRTETDTNFKELEEKIEKLIAEIGITTGDADSKDVKWD